MLNDNMDAAVLVRGYKKGASWSFPRGKINKDEDDLDCAVREVYEETGYDLRVTGLIERNEPVHPLEVTMHDQQVRLYVFRGIPENTIFETRTRKEIGAIQWYKVSDLPAYRKKKGAGRNNGADRPSNDKFYMVAPFMVQLRQWVLKQKKLDAQKVTNPTIHPNPQVLYEENMTDDNIIQEASPAPIISDAHPEAIDSATKELHRLLKMQPPTEGLQVSSPTHHNAGQALMSLLQSRPTGEGQASSHTQGIPHTPYDHIVTQAPQPQSPHHHHPTQRMPLPNYGAPPQFSVEPNQAYSQHRARPYVNVTTDAPNAPDFAEQPRQFQRQSEPVQLVHPQPLPPQVQKAMLLRDMASSPQIGNPNTNQPGPSNFSRENQQYSHGPPVPHHGTQDAYLERKLPTQLPAHSANLLNVLKGSAPRTNVDHNRRPASPQTVVNVSTEQYRQRQVPAPGNGFANQYGHSALPTGLNAMPTNGAIGTSSGPDLPRARPTDKHRAGLLDMFKKTEPSLPQNQLDGEGQNRHSSHSGGGDKKQHWSNHSSSTASTIRAAARDNGRPIQMNPETNLPYGALTILSRSRPIQSPKSPTGSSIVSARNTNETARLSTVGSQPSPKPSLNQASPGFSSKPSPMFHQSPPQKLHRQGTQSSPRTYGSAAQPYPYGSSQGNISNPLSLFPGSPSASALPVPSNVQPRQESTAEQKNALLSLFGKPKANLEQGKGKEPAMADQFGPGATPRSRLGSVASNGSGSGLAGIRGNASRRPSHQSSLSAADREFLLNFLENPSSGKRR